MVVLMVPCVPVICFTYPTNRTGVVEGDFGKGPSAGAVQALRIIGSATRDNPSVVSKGTDESRPSWSPVRGMGPWNPFSFSQEIGAPGRDARCAVIASDSLSVKLEMAKR